MAREAVQSGFIKLIHINGKINAADLFTKKNKEPPKHHGQSFTHPGKKECQPKT